LGGGTRIYGIFVPYVGGDRKTKKQKHKQLLRNGKNTTKDGPGWGRGDKMGQTQAKNEPERQSVGKNWHTQKQKN